MLDHLKVTGSVQVRLIGEDGQVKQEHVDHNLVTTVGKQWFAKKLAEEAVSEITHVAVGTGNTSPAVGDTQLVSETERVEFDSKVRSGVSVTMIGTFGPGVATGTLQEAGLFDGASGTTMLARQVFSGPYTKGASDSLEITWTISVS